MGVLFGNNFDASLSETCSGTVATSNTGLTRETAYYKFGAASIGALSGTDTILWTAFPKTSFNKGAIGFFARAHAAGKAYFIEITVNDTASNNNKIFLSVINSPSPAALNIDLTMYDNTGTVIISALSYSGAFTPSENWSYYEVDWLWNDAAGVTEVSHNGTVIITSTAGNSKSRLGSAYTDVQIRLGTGGVNYDYLDDFVLTPDRLNVGNFTPPSISQVVCTAGQISFNSSFGGRFGACFSR